MYAGQNTGLIIKPGILRIMQKCRSAASRMASQGFGLIDMLSGICYC